MLIVDVTVLALDFGILLMDVLHALLVLTIPLAVKLVLKVLVLMAVLVFETALLNWTATTTQILSHFPLMVINVFVPVQILGKARLVINVIQLSTTFLTTVVLALLLLQITRTVPENVMSTSIVMVMLPQLLETIHSMTTRVVFVTVETCGTVRIVLNAQVLHTFVQILIVDIVHHLWKEIKILNHTAPDLAPQLSTAPTTVLMSMVSSATILLVNACVQVISGQVNVVTVAFLKLMILRSTVHRVALTTLVASLFATNSVDSMSIQNYRIVLIPSTLPL